MRVAKGARVATSPASSEERLFCQAWVLSSWSGPVP